MADVTLIITAIRNGGAKAGQLTIDQRKASIVAIVARLYSLKGQGGDPETLRQEIGLAAYELEKEIAVKYPFFTMEEVRFALESGVKGEWDDDGARFQGTGLNVANYCRWLSAYRNSNERIDALQKIHNPAACPASVRYQLPAATVETKNLEACRSLYEMLQQEVQENGCFAPRHMDITLACVYNYLRSAGVMPRPSDADIEAAMATSKTRASINESASTLNFRAKGILLESFIQQTL